MTSVVLMYPMLRQTEYMTSSQYARSTARSHGQDESPAFEKAKAKPFGLPESIQEATGDPSAMILYRIPMAFKHNCQVRPDLGKLTHLSRPFKSLWMRARRAKAPHPEMAGRRRSGGRTSRHSLYRDIF